MQQRVETLDDALIRELLELHAERAHLHKISSRAQVQEQCDGRGEEPGVVTLAAKVNRCSGDKLATTYACNAAATLSSHPSSAVLTPLSILRTTKTVFPQHALVVSPCANGNVLTQWMIAAARVLSLDAVARCMREVTCATTRPSANAVTTGGFFARVEPPDNRVDG